MEPEKLANLAYGVAFSEEDWSEITDEFGDCLSSRPFLGVFEDDDCGYFSYIVHHKRSLLCGEEFVTRPVSDMTVLQDWKNDLFEFCNAVGMVSRPNWFAFGQKGCRLSLGLVISHAEWKGLPWCKDGPWWDIYVERSSNRNRNDLPIDIIRCESGDRIVALTEILSWNHGHFAQVKNSTLKRHSSNKNKTVFKNFCELMSLSYVEPCWIAFSSQ